MPISSDKLKDYIYDSTRDIYINEEKKIIISKEAIEDHDDDWLDEQIKASNGNDWFYIYTDGSSNSSMNELLKELGLE